MVFMKSLFPKSYYTNYKFEIVISSSKDNFTKLSFLPNWITFDS